MKIRNFYLYPVIAVAILLAIYFTNGRAAGLSAGTRAPELQGGPWFNSEPLKMANLRGKVVLVKMWTFG